MQEKVYLFLFIFCTTFPQEIFGKVLEEDVGESLNVLVREKRVISRILEEDVPVNIGEVPYLVNIKKNKRQHCLGSILAPHTVITAARCVVSELSNYEILVGSTIARKGVSHNITRKLMHGHEPSRSSKFLTGIALLTISPLLPYRGTVLEINMHAEPVLPGVVGTVSGWGSYVFGGACESRIAHKLRSIQVPVISHEECRNIYRGYFPITDEDFCTYHAQRLCGYTDVGAPFVINNELVGVYIGVIETEGRVLPIEPDVFVLVQHSEYRQWINRNIVF